MRRLLSDPRTLRSLDWVHEQLAQAVEEPLLREASARLWCLRQGLAQAEGPKRVALSQLVAMEQVLCQRLSPQWQQAYACVAQLLEHVVRASSAVEGLNSVMRMHQARQRHVSQRMLDLKRLYWNCRVFGHGKRKGHCPYELLGLKLPTYDWWTLLRMHPEAFEQNLLTQELAA